MTAATRERTTVAERDEERAGRSLLSPGWIPLVGAWAITAAVLVHYGVGVGDIVRFTAYTVLAGTLPGTLIWRALRGKADFLAFDAAFGTTMGFVVELPVYMLCRELGAPLAVLSWPVLTLVLFAAVPGLRRFWRGSGRRMPAAVAWALAAVFLYVLAVAAAMAFRANWMTEPYQAAMNHDYPFQFALVGEFKHDVPLNTPWVTGQVLQYHWYVYAHGAAASWLTGIEPQTLILRLLPLPMIAAFLVIMVALVRRLTARWWPGCAAMLLTVLGVAFSPWAWTDRPFPTGLITDNLWISPTQTFAALFFIAAVNVLSGLFAEPGRRLLSWLTFTLLIGAVAGAKATFVPMVLCGLLLAIVIRFLTSRRAGPELPAFGITLFWFAFAQIVLYGSGTQGTEVYPIQTVKYTQVGHAVLGRQGPVNDLPPLLTLTLLALLATAFGWAGMVGLLRRSHRLDPTVHVMAGFAASGVGGLWILAHPGLSQTYFGRSASPYLAMLSAVGLAALIPAGRRAPRWFLRLVVSGVLLGAAGLLAVQHTAGHDKPPFRFRSWSLAHVVTPYVMVVAIVAVLALAVFLIARKVRLGRAYTLAAVVVIVLGVAVTSGIVGARTVVDRFATAPGFTRAQPDGALRAGRWLRDHSAPADLVATNSHCRLNVKGCDSRDFWLAAYSERQVVLEGWSYTEKAFETGGLYDGTLYRSSFWDPALLAANDAVFYAPTAANVASFTRQHGVRWLVSVASTPDPVQPSKAQLNADPALGQFATERFSAGRVTVYEVTSS